MTEREKIIVDAAVKLTVATISQPKVLNFRVFPDGMNQRVPDFFEEIFNKLNELIPEDE